MEAVQADFNDPDKYPVDARGLTYSFAFIGLKRLGAGQFYLISHQGQGRQRRSTAARTIA